MIPFRVRREALRKETVKHVHGAASVLKMVHGSRMIQRVLCVGVRQLEVAATCFTFSERGVRSPPKPSRVASSREYGARSDGRLKITPTAAAR